MTIHEFTHTSPMPMPADELFAWHARPGALQRLLPPWQGVRVVSHSGGIRDGATVVLSVPVGPTHVRWVAEHRDYQPPESFADVQQSGPFALWEHTHTMIPDGPESSRLEDRVRYALPGGTAGDLLGGGTIRQSLEAMFHFRHTRTRFDLTAHARVRDRGPRRFLVSGAGGLVGSQLTAFLTGGGHGVTSLTRSPDGPDDIGWNPAAGRLDAGRLGGFDAVVHLAGESIVGRWTAAKKRRIRDSRLDGTRLLCETLASRPDPPAVLICASATGFYGDRGDETLTADSPPGTGFLAAVCREWEAACEPARAAGIRVVNLRIGLVLSPRGGLLGTLLPLFKAGLGGPVGGGGQWMPWIALDDLIDAVHTAAFDDSLVGPLNATAPNPVTNAEFTRTLGRVLGRPTLLPVPKFGVRLALGEAADELALSSVRAVPAKLSDRGHPFRFPHLEPALRFLLGKGGA